MCGGSVRLRRPTRCTGQAGIASTRASTQTVGIYTPETPDEVVLAAARLCLRLFAAAAGPRRARRSLAGEARWRHLARRGPPWARRSARLLGDLVRAVQASPAVLRPAAARAGRAGLHRRRGQRG